MGKDKRLKKEKELSKVQEAQKLLIAEQQKKTQACNKEINEVLKKHGFTLRTTPSQITLVPEQK